MLTFPLGKAPSTFASLGGTSKFFKEKQAISVGGENDGVIGTPFESPFYENTESDIDTAFIAFWAKPDVADYSGHFVVSFDSANSSTGAGAWSEWVFQLGKNGINIRHRSNERIAGVIYQRTNINHTYTANLSGFNHYMFAYYYGGQDHDFKLYVNGVERGTNSPDSNKGDRLQGVMRCIGGREFVFETGSPGGANFSFDSGWTGSLSGWYENLNGYYTTGKGYGDFISLQEVIDLNYNLFYDSAGEYVGATPLAPVTGGSPPDIDSAGDVGEPAAGTAEVDYTDVPVPSTTRPTI